MQKKEYGAVVKEYEFTGPEFDKVCYILNDTIKDCKNKHFQSFEYRHLYDISLTNMENEQEVISSIRLGYMENKSQF